MKTRHVCSAFATEEFHLSKNFRRVILWSKRAIAVLLIMGRHHNIFRYFDKLFTVAALCTGNASRRFTRRNMDFFHNVHGLELLNCCIIERC